MLEDLERDCLMNFEEKCLKGIKTTITSLELLKLPNISENGHRQKGRTTEKE
jgi:hypothetical protein